MIDWFIFISDERKDGINKNSIYDTCRLVGFDSALFDQPIKFVQGKYAKYQIKYTEGIMPQQYGSKHNNNKEEAGNGACFHRLIWFRIISSMALLKSCW